MAETYSSRSNTGIWRLMRTLEADAIRHLLPAIGRSTRVLDLGCGAGFYASALAEMGASIIYCVDFSKQILDQIEVSNCTRIESNIEAFRIQETFDVVLCAGALEFAERPEKVFQNVAGMLAPDGYFIVLLPRRCLAGWLYYFFHRLHHIKIGLFTKVEIGKMVSKAGFQLVSTQKVFPFSLVIKLSRLP